MSDRRHATPMSEPQATHAFMRHVEERYGVYIRRILGFRHFAEGRDGLLPVQRRSLWSLHGLHAVNRASSTKTSKAAGYTTGNMHPHGDGSVSGSIANMTQFNQRHPLVIGIGNFGWHDAPPSAPRYTSAYLSEYALTMMDASELTQVPMDATYDGKGVEPRFLPAKLPHLLVGGCQSLAAGFAGNIPPCEADWVLEQVRRTVDKRPIQRPDQFAHRWGGRLLELDESWMQTGAGSARFAPTIVLDGRRVLITSLAPGLSVARAAQIMERSPDLSSISEESREQNEIVRLVCTLRRGGDVNRLYAFAKQHLQGTTQTFSFLHIHQFDTEQGVDYKPIVEGPAKYLRRWVAWRTTVVRGAAGWRAERHERDIQRLRLTIRAIENRKLLVQALDSAKSKQDLEIRVRAILKCTEDEATYVVELQFYRLAFMNMDGIREQIQQHERDLKMERGIVARPLPRLITDAEVAHQAMVRSSRHAQVLEKPRERKRGRRDA